MLSETHRKLIDFHNAGQPVPAWLLKQRDAVYLMETNLSRGMVLYSEALRDEIDALDAAVYKGQIIG
jgi:hypothetical protein